MRHLQREADRDAKSPHPPLRGTCTWGRREERAALPAATKSRDRSLTMDTPALGHPDSIDRISPTIRPRRRAVMRQDWHHLLFLHWVVPADSLRRLLPSGLDLDLHEGKAY